MQAAWLSARLAAHRGRPHGRGRHATHRHPPHPLPPTCPQARRCGRAVLHIRVHYREDGPRRVLPPQRQRAGGAAGLPADPQRPVPPGGVGAGAPGAARGGRQLPAAGCAAGAAAVWARGAPGRSTASPSIGSATKTGSRRRRRPNSAGPRRRRCWCPRSRWASPRSSPLLPRPSAERTRSWPSSWRRGSLRSARGCAGKVKRERGREFFFSVLSLSI